MTLQEAAVLEKLKKVKKGLFHKGIEGVYNGFSVSRFLQRRISVAYLGLLPRIRTWLRKAFWKDD